MVYIVNAFLKSERGELWLSLGFEIEDGLLGFGG